ncbi:MAG TPA: FRG domain-containing protein [Bacillota bacterium]|nr:FRG domain-containing protein [Bacillota bacterium]
MNPLAPVTECIARVSTVEEYLSSIDQAYNILSNTAQGAMTELWFRGQVRTTFPLLPSIGRPDTINPTMEDAYLSKFESLVIPYVQQLPAFPLPGGVPTYWSWLVMMQHYGVPTRLLDWSRYALAALWFATNPEDRSIRPEEIDAAVWILNPTKLDQAFNFNPNLKPGYIPNMEEPGFTLQFGPRSQVLPNFKPAAAIAPVNNPNIQAQSGTFTVFPRKKELIPLENFEDASNYLLKICINNANFKDIQTQLRHYGITRLSLFPNITNIANEINLEVENENNQPTDP